jgi:hypothetical protein
MTTEEHKKRHMELHKAFDELLADWINTTNGLPSKASIMDLLKWSHTQINSPVLVQVGQERPIIQQGPQDAHCSVISIVFRGSLGPEFPEFVGIEFDNRKCRSVGKWFERDDGDWVLEIMKDDKGWASEKDDRG